MPTVPAWDDEARERFRVAQAAYGDAQGACADRLLALGAPGAPSQSTISEWLKDRTPRPLTRAVIFRYIDEAPQQSDTPAPGLNDGEALAFQWLVGDVAGEPMLGPRQANLTDAWIERGRAGPPTSPDDTLLRRDLMHLLGLGDAVISQMLKDEPAAPDVRTQPEGASVPPAPPEQRLLRYQELLATGLEDGSAKDPNWSRAAEALAAQLGVPWPAAPTGDGSTP